jgi:diguanylate cyclase (GGDEF)-like protein
MPEPGPPEIADRLAEARRLRFSPELEARYEADVGPDRARLLVRRGFLGMALFAAYLGIDWLITPDSFALALVLRLAVVALGAAVLLFVRRNPPALWREGLPVLVGIAGSAVTLVIMGASQSPLRDYHHFSLILMVLYLSLVLPVRFSFAAAAVAALLALDVLSVLFLPAASLPVVAIDLSIFIASSLLALIAARNFEQNMRLAYLFGQTQRATAERLENLNRHDPLTGLGNRRALDEAMERLGHDLPSGDIAVIVADIDHFKSYNDTLGHPAGDVCLKRVASLLASELRNSDDLAVRYGGEEFLLLLPATDLWTAIGIAERVRTAIAAAGIPHPGRPLEGVVTASFGVAAGRLGFAVAPQDLILAADSALYAAKNAGRIQVWPRPRSSAEVIAMDARRTGAAWSLLARSLRA